MKAVVAFLVSLMIGSGIAAGQSANVNASLPQCPFSRWQGSSRYCYECRWCPFRAETCCEMEDEIDVLKSVQVSGSDDWDCFITIVHFQQCGRCSPDSRLYLQNKSVPYAWDPRNFSIRPCRQACEYIWKQCKGATLLNKEEVVPSGMSVEKFCEDAPTASSPEYPCYNGVQLSDTPRLALIVAAVLLAVFGLT